MLTRVALMMVADGEGATKIMRLRVEGAESEATAGAVARAIADSPLVKTAMHGGDPNWGRIISSAGAAHGRPVAPEGATSHLAACWWSRTGPPAPVSDADRERDDRRV